MSTSRTCACIDFVCRSSEMLSVPVSGREIFKKERVERQIRGEPVCTVRYYSEKGQSLDTGGTVMFQKRKSRPPNPAKPANHVFFTAQRVNLINGDDSTTKYHQH
jgi:hypothetical protein